MPGQCKCYDGSVGTSVDLADDFLDDKQDGCICREVACAGVDCETLCTEEVFEGIFDVLKKEGNNDAAMDCEQLLDMDDTASMGEDEMNAKICRCLSPLPYLMATRLRCYADEDDEQTLAYMMLECQLGDPWGSNPPQGKYYVYMFDDEAKCLAGDDSLGMMVEEGQFGMGCMSQYDSNVSERYTCLSPGVIGQINYYNYGCEDSAIVVMDGATDELGNSLEPTQHEEGLCWEEDDGMWGLFRLSNSGCDKDDGQMCCRADTIECNACAAGLTLKDFCALRDNRRNKDCKDHKNCTKAKKASKCDNEFCTWDPYQGKKGKCLYGMFEIEPPTCETMKKKECKKAGHCVYDSKIKGCTTA